MVSCLPRPDAPLGDAEVCAGWTGTLPSAEGTEQSGFVVAGWTSECVLIALCYCEVHTTTETQMLKADKLFKVEWWYILAILRKAESSYKIKVTENQKN